MTERNKRILLKSFALFAVLSALPKTQWVESEKQPVKVSVPIEQIDTEAVKKQKIPTNPETCARWGNTAFVLPAPYMHMRV